MKKINIYAIQYAQIALLDIRLAIKLFYFAKVASILMLLSIFLACGSGEVQDNDSTPPEEETTSSSDYYQEDHRPQFHFSPEKMWMNDPNGMVYYEGEYHLFYQHYPDDNVWGPMHWGHAVSTDMLQWEHLPIALYPDDLGYIFSGSAVIDWNNTSGFGEEGKPPMIAIYTYHEPEGAEAGDINYQTQAIAYSNDKGRTWTKYEGNPVIANPGIKDFRDPKVIWDEDSKQWVMVLAVSDHVSIYGSPDLKNWQHLSDFGKEWGVHAGVWECPDLFPIKVEGTGAKQWVLILNINPGGPHGGSAVQYFVGQFDGKNFVLEERFAKDLAKKETAIWLDHGRDNYAGVTWSDIPKSDGRHLFLGWMSNWDYAQKVPTTAWRSAMTLPRELQLRQTDKGLRLFSLPVKEYDNIRGSFKAIESQEIGAGNKLEVDNSGFAPLFEIELELEASDGQSDFGVELSNDEGDVYRIGYSAAEKQFYSDRTKAGKSDFSDVFAKVHTAPRLSNEKTVNMHIFFDVASAELFADGGSVVLTDIFFPNSPYTQVQIYSDSGGVKINKGKITALNAIW